VALGELNAFANSCNSESPLVANLSSRKRGSSVAIESPTSPSHFHSTLHATQVLAARKLTHGPVATLGLPSPRPQQNQRIDRDVVVGANWRGSSPLLTDDTLDQCGVRAAEREALLLVTIVAFEKRLVKVNANGSRRWYLTFCEGHEVFPSLAPSKRHTSNSLGSASAEPPVIRSRSRTLSQLTYCPRTLCHSSTLTFLLCSAPFRLPFPRSHTQQCTSSPRVFACASPCTPHLTPHTLGPFPETF
jgi:hypothetical protein